MLILLETQPLSAKKAGNFSRYQEEKAGNMKGEKQRRIDINTCSLGQAPMTGKVCPPCQQWLKIGSEILCVKTACLPELRLVGVDASAINWSSRDLSCGG
jgi:hypothetical protein